MEDHLQIGDKDGGLKQNLEQLEDQLRSSIDKGRKVFYVWKILFGGFSLGFYLSKK